MLTRKSEHQLKQKRALTENCEMWKLESINQSSVNLYVRAQIKPEGQKKYCTT